LRCKFVILDAGFPCCFRKPGCFEDPSSTLAGVPHYLLWCSTWCYISCSNPMFQPCKDALQFSAWPPGRKTTFRDGS
jgi:hypothetical protein